MDSTDTEETRERDAIQAHLDEDMEDMEDMEDTEEEEDIERVKNDTRSHVRSSLTKIQ